MHKNKEKGVPMAGRKPKSTAVKRLEGNPAAAFANIFVNSPPQRVSANSEMLIYQRPQIHTILFR